MVSSAYANGLSYILGDTQIHKVFLNLLASRLLGVPSIVVDGSMLSIIVRFITLRLTLFECLVWTTNQRRQPLRITLMIGAPHRPISRIAGPMCSVLDPAMVTTVNFFHGNEFYTARRAKLAWLLLARH